MSYYYAPSYNEALTDNGLIVVGSESFGEYQGDYAYVVKSKDKGLGVVIIGYGSCSGCDAKEACDTKEEFEQLIQSIISCTRWGSVKELVAFINNEFDDNSWYRHDEGFAESKSAIIALIKGEQK